MWFQYYLLFIDIKSQNAAILLITYPIFTVIII